MGYERYDMEFTIAALRQLPRRSLRFDVLRERALEMRGSSSVQATVPPSPEADCEPRPKEICAMPSS